MRNVRGRSRWRLRGRRSVRRERERLASWRAAASWPSGWDVVCTKPTKGNNSEPLIKNNMTAIKLNLLPKCRQAALALPPSLLLSFTLSLSLFLSLSVCVCERITTQAVGHQGSLSVGIRIRRVCRAKQTRDRGVWKGVCARQPAEAPKWQNKRAYFMLPFYLPIPIPISTSTFILIQSCFLFHSRNMMTSLLATLLCMFFDTFWVNMQEQLAKV